MATGASVVPLIPDREKVGYDSQKGTGGAAEEEGSHCTGASVVPLIPDREKVGYNYKREQEELLKNKAATGASVGPLTPDREKVGYDSQ